MVSNQRENTIFVSLQNYLQSISHTKCRPPFPSSSSKGSLCSLMRTTLSNSQDFIFHLSFLGCLNSYKEKSVDIHECRQRQPHQSKNKKKACTAKCSVCTESDLNMIKLPCLISSKKKLPRITLISRKGCCQPLSGSKFNVLCYLLYPWHPVVGKQNACLLLLAKITIIYSYPGLLRKCSLCSVVFSICLPPKVFQSHLAVPRSWI